MSEVCLGDIRLRNRLVTSSSLLGYGAPDPGLVRYGMPDLPVRAAGAPRRGRHPHPGGAAP